MREDREKKKYIDFGKSLTCSQVSQAQEANISLLIKKNYIILRSEYPIISFHSPFECCDDIIILYVNGVVCTEIFHQY
jgi:hypothetical protein